MVSPLQPPEHKASSQEPVVPLTAGGTAGSSVNRHSPEWNPTTKLIIGLTLVAISAFLLIRFLNIVGPLLLAFVLAYLFHPLVTSLTTSLRISWRFGVTIIYLIVVIVLLGAIALGGLALVEQIQSLIGFLQNALMDLPDFIENFTSQPIQFGPFTLRPDLLNIDLDTIGQDILSAIQPLLTGAGSLVGTFASRAASFFGWTFFILLISNFILAESGGLSNRLINFNIPGYADDLQRMGAELNRIWNAFLRGQLIIVLLTILIYIILLGALGLKFFLGLALLAGLARFVPYVGPAVAWTSYGLVAFFQGTTIFGLPPLGYVALVVGLAWVLDMILDSIVVPRVMSDALRVHPAAVMVSVLIGANLLGVIGVVLAAPVMATVKLIVEYVIHKLFDLDPWEDIQTNPPPAPLRPLLPNVQHQFEGLRRRFASIRLPWIK